MDYNSSPLQACFFFTGENIQFCFENHLFLGSLFIVMDFTTNIFFIKTLA